MEIVEEIVKGGKLAELDKLVSDYELIVSNRKETGGNVKKR